MARTRAAQYSLDPALVCAVVEQESYPPWNPWSVRAEPAFDQRYVKPLHKTPTEEWARSMSWGLMQVMGEVARELGYTGDLPALCDPFTGLEWGCVQLRRKFDAAGGDATKALLAWNGGGNPNYAAEVMARVANYR